FTSLRLPPSHTFPLSLHDALPISKARHSWPAPWSAASVRTARRSSSASVMTAPQVKRDGCSCTSYPVRGTTLPPARTGRASAPRSEEHTSELQSRVDLVCRLLLEK